MKVLVSEGQLETEAKNNSCYDNSIATDFLNLTVNILHHRKCLLASTFITNYISICDEKRKTKKPQLSQQKQNQI